MEAIKPMDTDPGFKVRIRNRNWRKTRTRPYSEQGIAEAASLVTRLGSFFSHPLILYSMVFQ